MFNQGHAWLLERYAFLVLPEQERSRILSIWVAGRRHVLIQLQLKMSYLGQLPWVLMGLGHPDDDKAKECMRKGLALFNLAGDGYNHHWVTMICCVPGSELNTAILQYIAGTINREDRPVLMRFAARWRFASVVERWIEGRHALMKALSRAVRNASVVHLAYTGCWAPILRLVKHDPAFVENLARHCNEVRCPGDAIKRMGLHGHPGMVALRARSHGARNFSRELRPEVVEILYHVDALTMYRKLPSCNVDDPSPPAGYQPPPPPPPPPPHGHNKSKYIQDIQGKYKIPSGRQPRPAQARGRWAAWYF